MTGWGLCGLTIALGGFLAMGGPVHEAVALPDFEVQTSAGPMLFHDVSVDGHLRVNGSVTNKNDRKWTAVVFELELLNAGGRIVGHVPVLCRNLAPGQSKEFSEQIQLLDPKQREFSAYRALYRTGELEVTYVLTMLKPQRNRLLQYEDQAAAFSFSISDTCIDLKLKSNSSSSVMVDWNAARFTDIFEQSHPVTHAGTSKAAPFEKLSESIEPAPNAGHYEGWRRGGVLPRTLDAGELKGKTIGLAFPLESGGVKTWYQFVFQVAETLY